jgi:hypothetical protein
MNTKRSKRSARRQRADSVDATKGQYVSFDASFEQGTEPNSWLCALALGDGRVRAELMIGHWPRLLPSQPFLFANIRSRMVCQLLLFPPPQPLADIFGIEP